MEPEPQGPVDTIPVVRVWGPVEAARALAEGAPAAASSVLLKPVHAPAELLNRLRTLIPKEVLPHESDSADTLRDRLRDNSFFHSSTVLEHGHGRGGRYVELNSTTYAQPRRVQWAKPAAPAHIDADGDCVAVMPCYPHYYRRSPLLAMCEQMPLAIEELTKYASAAARPFLTPASRSRDPDVCELCGYYTAFESKMGRHRDNFVSDDLATYMFDRNPAVLTTQRNAQLANSNVLIWSMGNAEMVLQLSFPSDVASAMDRSSYEVRPIFSVPCSEGTLFVFAPTDDLFFCHEAFFKPATLTAHKSQGYRFAFVMRWLSLERAEARSFYVGGTRKGSVKPTESELYAEKQRTEKNRKARRRKNGLK